MAKHSIKLVLGVVFMYMSSLTYASHSVHEEKEVHEGHETEEHAHDEHESHLEGIVDSPDEIKQYIQHHLQDAHDFTLYTDHATGKSVGFPLPVIILDGGLKVFSSSKFEHGHASHEVDGVEYAIDHSNGRIYKEVDGEKVYPIDLSITKSVLGMLLIALLMIWMFTGLAKSYKKGAIPTGAGRMLEPIIVYVRDEIARPNIGEGKYKRFMSYLLTVFFFILLLNLLGLTPFGFNITGNFAVTVGLACMTVIVYITSSTKYFWSHTLWMPGVPYVLRPVLGVIELVGFLLIKPFALAIRLFANMSAGHTVVMSLIALIYVLQDTLGTVGASGLSVVLSIFIGFIEIFAAFLQAYVFTMLSALFIGMAVQEHH